jgi:hypothetical protein
VGGSVATLALIAVIAAIGLQASAFGGTSTRPRAAAARHLTIGLSDNSPAIFNDPRVAWLGVKIARLVVPWDVAKLPQELARQNVWLKAARAAGVEPLVAFEQDPAHPTLLPSVSAYGAAVKAFMKLYPYVRDYTPWNEENHYLQPTSKNPERAAQYYNLLKSYCASCSITAADVLDISNMAEWVEQFLRYANHPTLWGMHNYADLSSGTHTKTSLLLSLVHGQIWFTETGGVVWRYEHPNNGHRGYYIVHSEAYAAKVASHLVALANISPRITRVYYYQWRVPKTLAWAKLHGKLSWDSGLIRPDCTVRAAFVVIARAMGRNPNKIPRAKLGPEGDCISPISTPAPKTPSPTTTTTSTTTTTASTPEASGGSPAP